MEASVNETWEMSQIKKWRSKIRDQDLGFKTVTEAETNKTKAHEKWVLIRNHENQVHFQRDYLIGIMKTGCLHGSHRRGLTDKNVSRLRFLGIIIGGTKWPEAHISDWAIGLLREWGFVGAEHDHLVGIPIPLVPYKTRSNIGTGRKRLYRVRKWESVLLAFKDITEDADGSRVFSWQVSQALRGMLRSNAVGRVLSNLGFLRVRSIISGSTMYTMGFIYDKSRVHELLEKCRHELKE